MKYPVLFLAVGMLCAGHASAQVLTVDPAMAAAVATSNAIENSNMQKMRDKQSAIETLQASTAATVNFITQWQTKLYNGLTQVSGTLKNAWQVVDCGKSLVAIVNNYSKMINLASADPVLFAIIVDLQPDLVQRATLAYSNISSLVLAEKKDLLMDAGERMTILREVQTQLKIIEAMTTSGVFKLEWIKKQGIINALNPFSLYVQRDANIVQDILRQWKF